MSDWTPPTPAGLEDVLAAAQDAADASQGDSNDAEIEALQDALESALAALGLRMPAPHDDEEED